MSQSKRITLALCALMLVILCGGYFIVILQSSAEPEVALEPLFPQDPDMQAAYEKAQEGLDYFLQLAAEPPDQTQGFAIKARIRESGREEVFWLYPFEHAGDDFAGRINDEPSRLLKTFKGDIVTFNRHDIIDWTFDDTRVNVMHGNFTGCVELARQAPENALQFQEFFGLDCSR